MGASDAGENKTWRWRTGPESGTHFFTQDSDGSGCGTGGTTITYANWGAGEPNDFPNGCEGNEDYGHFLTSGKWNDFATNNTTIAGYVVEYGGSGGDPSLQLSGTVTVHVVPVETLTIDDVSVIEGGDLAFTVSLSSPVAEDAVITYSTADGSATTADSNYTSQTNQTLTIPAGQTSGTITIATTADSNVEPDETLDVNLTGVLVVDSSTSSGPIFWTDWTGGEFLKWFRGFGNNNNGNHDGGCDLHQPAGNPLLSDRRWE